MVVVDTLEDLLVAGKNPKADSKCGIAFGKFWWFGREKISTSLNSFPLWEPPFYNLIFKTPECKFQVGI